MVFCSSPNYDNSGTCTTCPPYTEARPNIWGRDFTANPSNSVSVASGLNAITKTASSGWGNAGATTPSSIEGDGQLDFKCDRNSYSIVGLSTHNQPIKHNVGPHAVDCGALCEWDRVFSTYPTARTWNWNERKYGSDNGGWSRGKSMTGVGPPTAPIFNINDIISLKKVGNTVTILKNGTRIPGLPACTLPGSSTDSVKIGVALHNQNKSVRDVKWYRAAGVSPSPAYSNSCRYWGGTCDNGELASTPQRRKENHCGSCHRGYYLDNKTCIKCPVGTYQNTHENTSGSSSCLDCGKGHVIRNLEKIEDLQKCPDWKRMPGDASSSNPYRPVPGGCGGLAGVNWKTWREDTGANDQTLRCEQCPKGTYQEIDGIRTDCKICPSGEFNPQYKKDQCQDCGSGYESKSLPTGKVPVLWNNQNKCTVAGSGETDGIIHHGGNVGSVYKKFNSSKPGMNTPCTHNNYPKCKRYIGNTCSTDWNTGAVSQSTSNVNDGLEIKFSGDKNIVKDPGSDPQSTIVGFFVPRAGNPSVVKHTDIDCGVYCKKGTVKGTKVTTAGGTRIYSELSLKKGSTTGPPISCASSSKSITLKKRGRNVTVFDGVNPISSNKAYDPSGVFTCQLPTGAAKAGVVIEQQGTGISEAKWTNRRVTKNDSCSICPVGTKRNAPTDTVCKACGAGKYQDNTGQSTCKSCPSGRWTTWSKRGVLHNTGYGWNFGFDETDPSKKCFDLSKAKRGRGEWKKFYADQCLQKGPGGDWKKNAKHVHPQYQNDPSWSTWGIREHASQYEFYEYRNCDASTANSITISDTSSCPSGNKCIHAVYYNLKNSSDPSIYAQHNKFNSNVYWATSTNLDHGQRICQYIGKIGVDPTPAPLKCHKCKCENGIGVGPSNCDFENQNKCRSCNAGYGPISNTKQIYIPYEKDTYGQKAYNNALAGVGGRIGNDGTYFGGVDTGNGNPERVRPYGTTGQPSNVIVNRNNPSVTPSNTDLLYTIRVPASKNIIGIVTQGQGTGHAISSFRIKQFQFWKFKSTSAPPNVMPGNNWVKIQNKQGNNNFIFNEINRSTISLSDINDVNNAYIFETPDQAIRAGKDRYIEQNTKREGKNVIQIHEFNSTLNTSTDSSFDTIAIRPIDWVGPNTAFRVGLLVENKGCVAWGGSCTNGNLATQSLRTQENHCVSCNAGYGLIPGNPPTCVACPAGKHQSSSAGTTCTDNVCTCTNGTPVTGSSCTTHNENNCSGCRTGFRQRGKDCVPNICKCANGTPVTGTSCTSHDANICSSCDGGYKKNADNTCGILCPRTDKKNLGIKRIKLYRGGSPNSVDNITKYELDNNKIKFEFDEPWWVSDPSEKIICKNNGDLDISKVASSCKKYDPERCSQYVTPKKCSRYVKLNSGVSPTDWQNAVAVASTSPRYLSLINHRLLQCSTPKRGYVLGQETEPTRNIARIYTSSPVPSVR